MAVALTDLATLYSHTGKYDEALPLFEQALDIIEKKLGPAHPSYGQNMNRLISLYEKNGKMTTLFNFRCIPKARVSLEFSLNSL